MPTKRDPNEDEDEDEYRNEGDDDDDDVDDDDEEDDFNPGDEDDDDDDEEDYEGEKDETIEDVSCLEGTLSLDSEERLHFQGTGFHLQSSEAVPWNVLDKRVKPLKDSFSLVMQGPCDVLLKNSEKNDEGADDAPRKKATPRQLRVTFTVADPNNPSRTFSETQRTIEQAKRTRTNDGNQNDDEDDNAKRPSLVYQWYAREVITSSQGMECIGEFAPFSSHNNGKDLLNVQWQVRMMIPEEASMSSTTPSSSVQTPTAAAASSGRRSSSRRGKESAFDDDDDDDDNIQDADDDGVDYDELIALHEDAGLSVDAVLRKRYRTTTPSSEASPSNGETEHGDRKKQKARVSTTRADNDDEGVGRNKNEGGDDEDDDDEDIAF